MQSKISPAFQLYHMRYNKSVALKLNLSKKQSVVALSVSTMCSKGFGFFREMLTAFYFGAGVVKDAFNVSQAIPTRIGSAFFGAINSSLVPYLIHLRNQEGEEAFWKAYSSIYRWLVTLLLLFTALMMIVPQPFIAILAPGFYSDPQRLSLTVFFIRFTALIFLFQVLSSTKPTRTYAHYPEKLEEAVYLPTNESRSSVFHCHALHHTA